MDLLIVVVGFAVGWGLAYLTRPKVKPTINLSERSAVVLAIEELTEAVVGLQLIIWSQNNPGIALTTVPSLITIEQVKADLARKAVADLQAEVERKTRQSPPDLE
jgi:hypothetical protein